LLGDNGIKAVEMHINSFFKKFQEEAEAEGEKRKPSYNNLNEEEED